MLSDLSEELIDLTIPLFKFSAEGPPSPRRLSFLRCGTSDSRGRLSSRGRLVAGDGARGGQVEDPLKFLVNALRQLEGIHGLGESLKGVDFLRRDLRAFPGSLQRGLRGVVSSDEARTFSDFGSEFHRGLEEVLEEPQVGIKIVDGVEGLRRIVAIPAQEFAHVGPVFLFDVGIVVFLVGTGAGELDGRACGPLTEGEQRVVDELGSVVRVNPSQREGEVAFDAAHGVEDSGLTFAQNGLSFYPARLDVDAIQGVEELSIGACARMRDQIDLEESGLGDLPMVGLDGNHLFEQDSWAGGAVDSALDRFLVLLESPVHLPGTDGEDLPL